MEFYIKAFICCALGCITGSFIWYIIQEIVDNIRHALFMKHLKKACDELEVQIKKFNNKKYERSKSTKNGEKTNKTKGK